MAHLKNYRCGYVIAVILKVKAIIFIDCRVICVAIHCFAVEIFGKKKLQMKMRRKKIG